MLPRAPQHADVGVVLAVCDMTQRLDFIVKPSGKAASDGPSFSS